MPATGERATRRARTSRSLHPARILMIQRPRQVAFDSYDAGELRDGQVRVHTLYSGISAGTELPLYRGTGPAIRKRWDPELRLFLNAADDVRVYPAAAGYEEVGVVTETAGDVADVAVGDHVYGSWGHRTETILPARVAAECRITPGADPLHGLFVRTGAIALNGILDAEVNVGETVAVFGAGIVGLLCMALAHLAGARVIAIDVRSQRLQRAVPFSDERLVSEAAVAIKRETRGRGADVVIEATGDEEALSEAIRSVAYSGKVVTLGYYQSHVQGLSLGEEFHQNRVQILCSQISSVRPELSYRWDVPRLERTILALQRAGRLDLAPLVSHRIPFEEAAEAYRLLDEQPDDAAQIVLTFPPAKAK